MNVLTKLNRREMKALYLAGATVLLLVVSVVVLVLNVLQPAPKSDAGPSTRENADAGTEQVEEAPTPSDAGDSNELMELSFDENGMVEFPTTKDPREAGIAAGAAMLSVDMGKIPFQEDFVALVAQEITTPYEGYVNMDGQLQNGPRIPFSEEEPEYMTAVGMIEYLGEAAGTAWPLSDSLIYERNYAPQQTVWRAQPIEAHLDTELLEAYPDVDPAITGWDDPTRDYTLKKESASLHHVFARYEVTEATPRQTDLGIQPTKFRVGMSLLVYCGPPDEGGVCAAYGMGFMPDEWEREWE